MIANLHGQFEIVEFEDNHSFRIFDNHYYEAYPQHWHKPMEIIYAIDQDYEVFCADQPYKIGANEFLLIAPGVLHSMPAQEGRRLFLQVDISFLHNMAGMNSLLTMMAPALALSEEKIPRVYPKIISLFEEIQSIYTQEAPLSEPLIYARLLEFLVLIGRQIGPARTILTSNLKKQEAYTLMMMDLCDYLSDHCDENITLEGISEDKGFSKYHFSRLFKQFTGYTFYRYLNHKRIEKAEKLLMDDVLRVSDIALSCGFNNLSGFIRMFKKIKGCTPSQYKEKYTA